MDFVRACEPAVVARCSIDVEPKDALASVRSRSATAPLVVGHLVDDNRFPVDHRLVTGSDFERVFAGAMRSSDRYFTILARRNELGRARLGLAISKRVAKRAVDRNRLKRIAREAFRTSTQIDCDFVVMARPAAVGADNAELRRSLERLFERMAGTFD